MLFQTIFTFFFRVVKHSKKILADNQLFTGLRDGSPGLSLGTPHPPYGALPKSCLHQRSCHNDEIFKMLIIIVHAVAYNLFTVQSELAGISAH